MTVEEINLYDLLRFYIKKWLTIAIFVMIGGIVGIAYTYYIQTPQYESKATLLLVGTNRTAANQESVALNNYVELFKSRRVLEPVITDQGYDKGYDALASGVTAQGVKGTDVINVSIKTPDAKQSKLLLEGAIESFRNEAKELYGNSSIKINTVDAASTPKSPSNVRPVTQIGLSAVAGFILAIIGLFFVYDYRHSQPKAAKTGDSHDDDSAQAKDQVDVELEADTAKKDVDCTTISHFYTGGAYEKE